MSTREFCSVCGEIYQEVIIDPQAVEDYIKEYRFNPMFTSFQKRSVCSSCYEKADEKVWARFKGLEFHTSDYVAVLYAELDKMGA